jgi:ATP synthase protein I
MATTGGGKAEGEGQEHDFQRTVAKICQRKVRAERKQDRSIWMGMGMFGMVGWSIALPALLGLLLGHWLDARVERGFSWTLALMLAGLALGSFNAWGWMQKTTDEGQLGEGEDEA